MRERGIHRIEVHVAAVCVGQRQGALEVLALKRSPNRALFPNFWEGVGGQVKEGESLEEAILRHLLEESGISGRIRGPFTTYVIEPGVDSSADTRIPGVRFSVKVDGTPNIIVDPAQHQDSAWVPVTDLARLDWIPGLLPQIEQAIAIY